MKTCKHTERFQIPPDLSPRPAGGFFIPGIFSKQTYPGLTKVNILRTTRLLPATCKEWILLSVMPSFAIVNKIARILYVILGYWHSLSHPFYNFNFFELPLRLGRQARFLYLQLPGMVSSKIGRLYNPLLIFEFCFFT